MPSSSSVHPVVVLSAFLSLVASASCAGQRGVSKGTSSTLAIEHVTAIPMDGDRRIADATILIEGDRITGVVPATAARLPTGATRIDGRGLFAVPGFADMHVHPYDTEGFVSYLAYGITTIAVMHGSPTVLEWRSQQRRGTLDGPTIYTASPTVNGYPAGNPLFIAVQDTLNARRVARDQKRAGYDFIKAYSFLNADVYRALLEEAHAAGIPVVGHIPFQVPYRDLLAAGQANVAHIEEFFQNGDVPDDSMPVVAAAVKRAGTTVTANLFAYIDYLKTIADLPGVLSDPEMRFASGAMLSEKLPTSNRATNRADLNGFAAFLRTRLERFKLLLRAFDRAGVSILVGTDGETFGFPGQSAQLEMFALADAGLTPYGALRAASSNAGDFITKYVDPNERFGRLMPGMRADVVLLRADPLTDIRNIGRVAGVVARGRWYSENRLREMRDSVAKRTAPQREFAQRFDSLVMKAKAPRQAADALRSFTRLNPGVRPLAELVWSGYGRLTFAKDSVASTEIREMEAAAYQHSASARYDVARAYLLRGDTATALDHMERARALVGYDFVLDDVIARLRAAKSSATSPPLAVAFDSISVRVQGQDRHLLLRVELTPAQGRMRGRVTINSDTTLTATEAVANDDGRAWVFVPYAGETLELRWTRSSEGVTGTWVFGWANNGVLRGRPQN